MLVGVALEGRFDEVAHAGPRRRRDAVEEPHTTQLERTSAALAWGRGPLHKGTPYDAVRAHQRHAGMGERTVAPGILVCDGEAGPGRDPQWFSGECVVVS